MCVRCLCWFPRWCVDRSWQAFGITCGLAEHVASGNGGDVGLGHDGTGGHEDGAHVGLHEAEELALCFLYCEFQTETKIAEIASLEIVGQNLV